MSGGHHHSPLHNMSPAAHHILDLKKAHFFHFDVWQTDYIEYFKPIMPAEWQVIDMDWNVYPYGYLLQSYERGGVSMTFAGPMKHIKHRRALIKGNESFMLWFMQMPYEGAVIKNYMFNPSELLGYTPTHAIYAYQLTTKVPSWPQWREELKKLLRLTPKTQAAA